MYNFRTDLALERRDIFKKNNKLEEIDGIETEEKEIDENLKVEKVKIINENGEKFFKLVELITDDKKFPQKKANRIVGAIRVKERQKVS